ncbi:MAG: LEPR-XLL domain-containing protein, partial [Planctomycetota bacterium]
MPRLLRIKGPIDDTPRRPRPEPTARWKGLEPLEPRLLLSADGMGLAPAPDLIDDQEQAAIIAGLHELEDLAGGLTALDDRPLDEANEAFVDLFQALTEGLSDRVEGFFQEQRTRGLAATADGLASFLDGSDTDRLAIDAAAHPTPAPSGDGLRLGLSVTARSGTDAPSDAAQLTFDFTLGLNDAAARHATPDLSLRFDGETPPLRLDVDGGDPLVLDFDATLTGGDGELNSTELAAARPSRFADVLSAASRPDADRPDGAILAAHSDTLAAGATLLEPIGSSLDQASATPGAEALDTTLPVIGKSLRQLVGFDLGNLLQVARTLDELAAGEPAELTFDDLRALLRDHFEQAIELEDDARVETAHEAVEISAGVDAAAAELRIDIDVEVDRQLLVDASDGGSDASLHHALAPIGTLLDSPGEIAVATAVDFSMTLGVDLDAAPDAPGDGLFFRLDEFRVEAQAAHDFDATLTGGDGELNSTELAAARPSR